VWVKQRPGFKIKLLNDIGAFVENWLALALTTILENWGTLDPMLKFVQVRNAPAAVALQVLSVGNIICCAHVIQEIATSRKP
jgi:fumarate reductase subunit C